MPSFKSHIAALILRHTRKKAFASAEGMNAWIAAARRVETHLPPRKLAGRVEIRQRTVAGCPVYEVRPRTVTSPLRLVYLHGGPFVFEIGRFHWAIIAELAERVGARVTVPIYPIAPEHSFDEIFGMPMALYEEMLGEEKPENIVMVGDSAGANMAVVMAMLGAERGLPGPGRHVLISPGLDMTLANPDVFTLEKIDPWLGIPGGLEAVRLYAGDIPRTDWRISPLYGDLSVLPRTLIFTGTHEILYPDTVIFAQKAREAGVDVELVVEPGMFHDWPLLAQIREAHRARDRIVRFLNDAEREPLPATRRQPRVQPGEIRSAPSP